MNIKLLFKNAEFLKWNSILEGGFVYNVQNHY